MPKIRGCSLKASFRDFNDLRPMSSRFEFLIRNSVSQRPCSYSDVGAWSCPSHNKANVVRNRNNAKGHDAKKKKLKRKQKIINGNDRGSEEEHVSSTTNNSSFIGFNKIASSKTRLGKIIWSFLTLGCLIGFLYQALKFALVYHSLPTEVILRIENNGTVEFPAVTVCNNNRIRRSQYCKHYPDVCEFNSTVKIKESKVFDAYFDALNHVPEYKSELGHSLKIVRGCIFKGIGQLNKTECLNRFIPFFDPDYGNCFTFLPKDHETGIYLAASESDFWQKSNALNLLLDTEEEEYTERGRHRGFTITVHSNDFLPDLHTDSVAIEPGSVYSLAVQQSITKLLPHPFSTNCTSFEDLPWISEHYMPSSRICTVECSRHEQFKNCQYVTRNLSLFYDKFPWDSSSITEEQKMCASFVEERTKTYCRSLCGVPCEDIQFEVAVGKTALQVIDVVEFDLSEVKNNPKWQVLLTFQKKNSGTNPRDFVAVKVFYKSIEKKLYEHSAMYDDLELFSYLGGYSGVWLGFSLLNLFEFLEIIVMSINRAVSTCRKNTKRNQKKFRFINRNIAVPESLFGNSFHKPTKVKISNRKRCLYC